MKILTLIDNEYKWLKVNKNREWQFKNGWIHCLDEEGKKYQVKEMNVVKIIADFRNKYVVCGGCGKLVDKNKLEEHYEFVESHPKCSTCCYFKPNWQINEISTKEKVVEEGKKLVTKKLEVVSGCEISTYRGESIKDSMEKKHCSCFNCRRNRTYDFTSDFTYKFPKAKETLVTISAFVTSKKWEIVHKSDDYMTLNRKNSNLMALFNSLGILEYFYYEGRDTTKFIYMPAYDKFAILSNRTFWESDVSLRLPSGKRDMLVREIKELYKEDK